MNSSESTIQDYDQAADKYEIRWKKYLDHTHQKFLRRIKINEEEVILDVSAGTGILAHELIKKGWPFRELVLNDPSEGMLELARKKVHSHRRITFTCHLAHRLPFEENGFDKILCLNSFHCYKHQDKALKRFHKILKPGGKLYLLDWNRSGLFKPVNQIIKWSLPELIDSRSLHEIEKMLDQNNLHINNSESWNWRYWKFLFLEAEKLKLD